MRNGRLGIVVAAACFLGIEGVEASQYECREANEGAYLTTDRSVSSNHGDRKCRWTIDGAKSSAAPGLALRDPLVTSAFNSLIAGRFDDLSRSSPNLSAVALLLVGPFRGSNLDGSTMASFENVFRNEASQVSRCISAGSSGGINVDSPEVVCRWIVPRDNNSVQIWRTEVMPSQPLLVLGVQMQNQRYLLFMPETLLRAGRGGFQFR
jgi:hypothetical protein